MSDMMRQGTTPVQYSPYDRNTQSFSDLTAEAVEIQGFELIKEERTDFLAGPLSADGSRTGPGVPFLITRVTFRRGMADPKNKGRRLAYVSCECVIADEPYLERKKIKLDGTPFLPNDHIVFNDGSTGVYRQIMAVLESQGYIVLPEGPVTGAKGESRFDLPPSEWLEMPMGESWVGEVGTDDEGFVMYQADVRIFAPRGLRLSDYRNEYTENGKTRYLA